MKAHPTERVLQGAAHTTTYFEAGDPQGPLVLFLHGWPELALSWRHQLACFASLGFRAVAPDMRGYGGSTVHPRVDDYRLELVVGDMLALADHLGCERAVWVGHDWGSPVVWSIASHHPERALAVANLCVPYHPQGFALPNLIETVNRARYPQDEFPAGQWDYQAYYQENFERATAVFDANPVNTVKAMFRKGSAAARDKPARLATIRRDGGWFGGADAAPELPLDTDLLTEEDLHRYASALARNGFFGPDAWYMNGAANMAYAKRAKNGGRLDLPVLFLHAGYDYTCDTTDAPLLVAPMRASCADLTEATLPTGHWMAQEQPARVNAALVRWLAAKLPRHWPA
jgi:pimeloyl-ACP methyl ester carboxylesterase